MVLQAGEAAFKAGLEVLGVDLGPEHLRHGAPDHLRRIGREGLQEGAVGLPADEIAVDQDDEIAGGVDDAFIAPQPLFRPLAVADIAQRR